jgi:hypothetical protein
MLMAVLVAVQCVLHNLALSSELLDDPCFVLDLVLLQAPPGIAVWKHGYGAEASDWLRLGKDHCHLKDGIVSLVARDEVFASNDVIYCQRTLVFIFITLNYLDWPRARRSRRI